MHSRTRAVALLAALLMAAADATPLAAARAPQGTTAASSNAQGAAGRVWGMQDIVTAVRDRVNDMRNAAGAALPAFEIAPGVMMPAVSVGHPDDEGTETASADMWLKAGGVGIDTAYDYHNQDQVAVALKGRNRSSYFVTTKISPADCTANAAIAAVKEDLKELGLQQVDLVLHHFPCSSEAGTQAIWKGLMQAKLTGLARAVGVSNFKAKDIDAVLSLGVGTPAVNQCSMSVGNHDDATIAHCRLHNITYESFSPLRRVDLGAAVLKTIAAAHKCSTAQVALRWVNQLGHPLTTSPGVNEQYTMEDLALGGFTLSAAEMHTLSAM